METELGVLPWMCRGWVCMYGLCRGEPPGGSRRPGRNRRKGRERRGVAQVAQRRELIVGFLLCVLGRQGELHSSAKADGVGVRRWSS